jgi:hypothetical protein
MIQEPVKQHVAFLIKEADEELLAYIDDCVHAEWLERNSKGCPICKLFSDNDAKYCRECGYYWGENAKNEVHS